MFSQTKLKLTIPQPCQGNWEMMENVKGGKHCRDCAKDVIDFSGMTETQVIRFFKNNPGKVCGRFSPDQLERDLVLPRKNNPVAWLTLLGMAILAIPAAGRGKDPVMVIAHPAKSDGREPGKAGGKPADPVIQDGGKRELKGQVLSSGDSTPLPGASVLVKGTQVGTSTDLDGNFKLEYPVEGGQIILVVSYIGFETKEIIVSTAKDPDIKLGRLTLELAPAYLGEVLVYKPFSLTGLKYKVLNLISRIKG